MPIEGIDASHYQGDDIQWPEVAADGKKFVILKATDGCGFNITTPKKRNIDALFLHNEKGARATEMLLGMYPFLRPNESLDGQLNSFCAMAIRMEGPYFTMIDAEGIPNKGGKDDWEINSKDDNFKFLLGFIRGVQRNLGLDPICYMGDGFFARFLPPEARQSKELAALHLAVARYGLRQPEPFKPWDRISIHQYSAYGKVKGFGPKVFVDLNRWFGTFEELKALTIPKKTPEDAVHRI